MLIGAAAMGVVGLFSNGKPLPMVVGMASGALMGLVLTWITLGSPRPAPSQDAQSRQ
jgi:DHA1 family bicyclomycin/chloramphenicol resistance-like MFS transporter